MKKVFLPQMGQTMEEGVIENWRVEEGGQVSEGDVLLEITTDKATLEVESFVTGTVRKIFHGAGETVPVNTVIALVGEPDEEIPADMLQEASVASTPAAAEESVAPATDAAPAPATATAPVAAAPSGRVFSSPRARKRAAAERVPIAPISGTGPNARIVEADVIAYAARAKELRITPAARALAAERGVDLLSLQPAKTGGRIGKKEVMNAAPAVAAGVGAATAAAGQRVPLTAMRRIVGERLSQSKREAPHFYEMIEIDMTESVRLRKALNAAGSERVSFNDMLVRAMALALPAAPEVSAHLEGDEIVYSQGFNVGIAVAIDDGLIVPVIRNVVGKSLAEIAAESAGLIERARNKRLTPDEYTGGSVTVSSLGMMGIESFIPIINPGECVILGVGRIAEKPVVIDGGIHVRSIMSLSASCDHRVIDGARAAAFLNGIRDAIETPDSLG